jgi:peptidase E
LRQATFLSGFDIVFKEILADKERRGWVYSGYSAGVCLLAPDLKCLQIVDNPKDMPYGQDVIW